MIDLGFVLEVTRTPAPWVGFGFGGGVVVELSSTQG